LSSNANKQQDKGQDLNVLAIVTTGAAFVLITIVVIMYLYGLYLRTDNAEEARKSGGLGDEVYDLKQGQQMDLATAGWIDPQAGVVRIPIDEAIKLTAEKYSNPNVAAEQAPEDTGDNPCEGATDGAPQDTPVAGGDGSNMAGRPSE